ncbi:MAG: NAD(P)H-dependent oxidoreductase [Pseudomonadota bacterium]
MKVLVLYAHPVAESYGGALHAAVLEGLAEGGHAVDDCDLYAEGFDPVLTREERLAYHDTAVNRAPVERYVERLLAAEALVIVCPIWNFGVPAILKGFMDRVFLPGVTFRMADGKVGPANLILKRLVCVHTYGASRRIAWLAGDPPRRQLIRILGGLLAPRAPKRYLALYGMNTASEARRAAFLARVRRTLATL